MVLFAAYLGFATFVWHAMNQPPEVFGAAMAHLPQPYVFLVLPFETLWMRARAGSLHVGDAAPDFRLTRVDKSGSIQLSALNRQEPVVLVFGSYT